MKHLLTGLAWQSPQWLAPLWPLWCSPPEDVAPSLCRCWVAAITCWPAYMGGLPPVLSRPGCTGPPCQKVTKYGFRPKSRRPPRMGGGASSAGVEVPWHPSIRSGEGETNNALHMVCPWTHLSLFSLVRYLIFLSLHARPFFDAIFAHPDPNNIFIFVLNYRKQWKIYWDLNLQSQNTSFVSYFWAIIHMII